MPMNITILKSLFLIAGASTYHPPQPVVDLANRNALTDLSREVFYLNQPLIIKDKKFLNKTCVGKEAHSKELSLLGCYLSTDRGIFIYSITDKRLEGTMETTAAHELLHAMYIRLTQEEREKIDQLIQDFYKSVDNQDVRFRIRLYPKNKLYAELHSILGSEFETLPKALEDYYSRYFKDRKKVVSFSMQSKSEISRQVSVVAEYDKKLNLLKPKIEQQTKDITNQTENIAALKHRLNAFSKSNVREYNQLSDHINKQIKMYNQSVLSYDRKVNDYNSLSNRRNSLASEAQELIETLDTRDRAGRTEE